MSRYTLEISEPGDYHPRKLNVLVRFLNADTGCTVEYRTAGTIRHAEIDTEKILKRLNQVAPRLPGIGAL